jgi:APA family basic amino acid/polyamine antiporter
MIAYTGIETVSNLAEEARDPPRDIPRSISWVAGAVFAIYFTLPLIALSALPVRHIDGSYETQLGQPPRAGGFANDPVLGLVEHLGLHGAVLDCAKVYVGLLAATILFIATNAGRDRRVTDHVCDGELPAAAGALSAAPSALQDPWLSLVVFAGFVAIAVLLPGKTTFLGDMYAFGAMLSFTIAHASVIALRYTRREREMRFRARPNLVVGGVSWPLFAILGGLGTAAAWIVVVIQKDAARWVGLGWLLLGLAFYAIYRRFVVHAPLRQTVRARS